MADPAPAQQQNEARGGGNNQQQALFQSLFRGILFYFIVQNIIKGGPQKPGQQKGQPLPAIKPLMRKGEFLDMWLYIDEEPLAGDIFNATSLYHFEENIKLGEEIDPSFMKHIEVELTQGLLNNGSLYAHVFFARSGKSPHKADPAYEEGSSWGKTHNLIEYRAPMKVKTERNLMTSKEEDVEAETNQVLRSSTNENQVISFFKPNITINIVDDFSTYPGNGIPPQLKDHLVLEPSSGHYYPTIFMNDFWLLRENWVPINDTLTTPLNLTLQVAPISLLKWQMMMQMEESFRTQSEFGAMGDGDSDELKRMLLEGNPYLLAVTGVVSLLHTVFDMLAFKNDVSFWRQNKSMQGLSLRTIIINCSCQFIILLYLLDNETSWVVLFSTGLGLIIELWKVTKAVDVAVDRSRSIPRLSFKYRESYVESNTRTYDDEAMRYLSWVLFPLMACYAVYSMLYQNHKSWYSFILGTLVGCVYTFGFVLMCPQLYINYRLKSVAHLPWRQMTYKFLNTIIDDLFAFVIKMPTLHRLSVFRDDLIFIIYLYQRWVYRVDLKRVNEFGFGGGEGEEALAIAGTPTAAATEGTNVVTANGEKVAPNDPAPPQDVKKQQ